MTVPLPGDRRDAAGSETAGSTRTVLWLTKGLGRGGMEQLLVNHSRVADRDAFEYRAAFLVDRPHSVADELVSMDVPVTRLGSGRALDPRWVRDLLREVAEVPVDLIHAHSPLPASVARMALRLTRRRIPVVVTEHNRWDRYAAPTRILNRITFGLNDAALAVSDDCRSTMPSRVRDQVTVVEHGIDSDRVTESLERRDRVRDELGVGEDTVVVGTVAHLRRQKNYPLMISVAERVVAEHDDVVFLTAGQGPLEEELKAIHADTSLGDRFRFLGFRTDATDLMAAFDIFLLTSSHEGLPVSLMEAMTLGRPVVCTAVGGIPEMVTDGTEGRVVPAGSEDLLVGALGELIGDRELRARCGDAARATTRERFSSAAATTVVEDVYREVLGLSTIPSSPIEGTHGQ